MLENKDHDKYDYIDIIVKKENADEVVSSYGKFLWKELYRKEDKSYSDVIHVSFYRARDIQNKDRLQLLQVYYEFALNEKAELMEKKHHKSKAGICNLIVFSLCLFVGIWWLIFYLNNLAFYIVGVALTLIIAGLDAFFGKKLKNLYKKENQRFKLQEDEIKERIDDIFNEVESLTKEKERGEL